MKVADTSVRSYVPAPPPEEIFAEHTGYPYLDCVPKDMEANLRFRKKLLLAAADDPKVQASLRRKCREDLLFWVNAFVWLLEPRTRTPVPFITYAFQDKALLEIQESLGHHDLVIVKSRDQGGTWMVMTVFTYEFQFFARSEFQLTSRIETDVDTVGDHGKLLPKADWILDNQPKWLAPPKRECARKHLNLRNLGNGSLFHGFATSAHSGRGDRRRGMLYDEFAMVDAGVGMQTLATSQAVGTRIWCSTPKGPSGAFARQAHDKNIKRIDLDWSEHPQKNPGLYSSIDGRLELLDPRASDFEVCDFRVPNYETKEGSIEPWPPGQRGFPPDYKFVLDGQRRSPYFDLECRRSGVPQHIAQELGRDFLRSGNQFFDQTVLDKARQHCRPPEYIGNFDYESDSGHLRTDKKGNIIAPLDGPGDEHPNGRLKLWANLCEPYVDLGDPTKRDKSVPPRDITSGEIESDAEYVLGVDVSAGSGASNSCIIIIDCHTGEMVGEYADPHIAPHELAPLVKAIGTWLNNALVIWDGGGPCGAMFRKAFLRLAYPNYWLRRNEEGLSKKVSETPGWFGKGQMKAVILEGLTIGLGAQSLHTYSNTILNEAAEYVWTASGTPEHSSVPGNKDPTAAKAAHGDRVMAFALAWHVAPETTITEDQPERVAMPGSLAYIREQDAMNRPEDRRLIRGALVL